jgi:hypothetical protein
VWGAVAYSRPRWPGHHGQAGRAKGTATLAATGGQCEVGDGRPSAAPIGAASAATSVATTTVTSRAGWWGGTADLLQVTRDGAEQRSRVARASAPAAEPGERIGARPGEGIGAGPGRAGPGRAGARGSEAPERTRGATDVPLACGTGAGRGQARGWVRS